ncbi:hypothetical protein GCM10012275_35050 [Longimycelium tulufanense]|uniref:YcaO domain-containing protein n=1 Tax=Longimycelium tulufanense TaxID=907463 RepID=A0A8J3CFZ1_9PSEU|nr:TOMM precursor leader peptide-binding protein [Longimycelium tulufanense]GGM60991.1 hypothetical protein GCM10012275_35050 [Longimycelium tulufanense]
MADIRFGPGWRRGDRVDAQALATAGGDAAIAVNRGWDLSWERKTWSESAHHGRAHLSVRHLGDEVLVGPLWINRDAAGCSACAEYRGRVAVDHPLLDRLAEPVSAPIYGAPLLDELLDIVVRERPLRAGELIAVSTRRVARHRIRRSLHCPVCTPRLEGARIHRRLSPRPTAQHPPVRDRREGIELTAKALRNELVDTRFGPVLQLMREINTPFAMTGAFAPDSRNVGYGRAVDLASAETIAILETYERMGGFPHHRELVTNTPYRRVARYAIDPARFGSYTRQQLEHRHCTVLPYHDDTPIDWVWGNRIADGEPILVPAEIGFYLYENEHRLDYHASRRLPATRRRNYFDESSSGCALGSTVEEAALHSLLELAERDSFLTSWHRGQPLPRVDPATVDDPTSGSLLDLIDANGFDTHLLVASHDLGVPVVWGLAINRARAFPASYSAAGSGVDPLGAVRAALWELAQITSQPPAWTEDDCVPLLADPWEITQLEDHVRLYQLPATLPIVESYLGGPVLPLHRAFPGWPGLLVEAAAGDVLGALNFVARCFSAAGLDDIVLVDQSTVEHRDLGFAVVKAAVPGIVPMCFGHAQQRLVGLPRLRAALDDVGVVPDEHTLPLRPHPFP